MPGLTYRWATQDDYPRLIQYRIECGWGEDFFKQVWGSKDWAWCVFSAPKIDDSSDQKPDSNLGDGHASVVNGGGEEWIEDVGMGGWQLDNPDDQEDASRKDRIVHLSSLFITKKYRGLGLGSDALDILEQVAKEEFEAKWVTLNTAVYQCTMTPEGWFDEDMNTISKNFVWYQRRGYKEIRERVPMYPEPKPDEPDRKLIAGFLRKDANLIVSTR